MDDDNRLLLDFPIRGVDFGDGGELQTAPISDPRRDGVLDERNRPGLKHYYSPLWGIPIVSSGLRANDSAYVSDSRQRANRGMRPEDIEVEPEFVWRAVEVQPGFRIVRPVRNLPPVELSALRELSTRRQASTDQEVYRREFDPVHRPQVFLEDGLQSEGIPPELLRSPESGPDMSRPPPPFHFGLGHPHPGTHEPTHPLLESAPAHPPVLRDVSVASAGGVSVVYGDAPRVRAVRYNSKRRR